MRTLNKQQEGKENKKLHSWGSGKGFLKEMRFEQSCEDFIMVYKNPNRQTYQKKDAIEWLER